MRSATVFSIVVVMTAAMITVSPGIAAAADSGLVIKVSQDGKGDFNGNNEEPIRAAIQKASHSGGGMIEIGPGKYLIRRELKLTSGITIRGTKDTILKLASPVLVAAPAKQGQDFLVVSDTSELTAGVRLDVYPPVGMETFPDTVDTDKKVHFVEIDEIQSGRLSLSGNLPCTLPIPERSRVGYCGNMFFIASSAKNVTIENLVIDGGRKNDIPMPGHSNRCAVLAHGTWSYKDGPTAPPIENLRVVGCRIRNCYGRAVAMYAVVRGRVEDCRIEDIADEAIDLDHFCLHCEVLRNEVKRCVRGVTINDASYCTVADNRLEDCGKGVEVWWWYMCPQENLNVENLIKHNFIYRPKTVGIALGPHCRRNRVIDNVVEGGIQVVEKDNVVENNTPVGKP